ncbi:hypothetical protein GCM10009550_53750 [Actinocorallia libanotica]|uniref:Subtilisin inhibitor-like n=2 Tax=Actinocorallia libanotica TaxID=46162 RepID=A0ABN1RPU9_9ACTN
MRLMMGLAAGILLFGAAACGGSDAGTEIASAGGDPTVSASASPGAEGSFVKYAACMRENGIPMEDPEVDAGGRAKVQLSVPEGVDKSTVEAAEKKCRPLMPNGGELAKANPEGRKAMLAMSRCMRENGYPTFPDPSPDGGMRLDHDSGIDFSDPAFQAAQEKCQAAGGVTDVEKR